MEPDTQLIIFFQCNVDNILRYVYMGVSIIRVPQTGWFIMENTIKRDDLGVPLFQETTICLSVCVMWMNKNDLTEH